MRHAAFGILALVFLTFSSVVPSPSKLTAEPVDWPQFRGPTGDGHALAPMSLPTRWSSSDNVAWKRPVPGKGWSSPVVHQGCVYFTSAVDITRGDSRDKSLRAMCLDAKTGQFLWDHEVFLQDGATTPRIHTKNSYASPTPIVDDGQIFVHFGHEGTACLNLNGEIVWRNSQLKYQPTHGNGGSPILADNLLVFSCDGSDQQFIVSLDRHSGRVVWKRDRETPATKTFSFSTPLLISHLGRRQIISPGSDCVCSYDPATGRELWRVHYTGYSVIPRPVFGHGLVFVSTSYDRPELIAIRPDGDGDVTDTHIAWRASRGAPHTPSMLLVGQELFMVSDRGVASCLDAKSGQVHWSRRLGGNFSASPVFADGLVYLQSEEGNGVVIRASTEFERVAENPLGERTLASYALTDGVIFIRSEKNLFRIATH